MIWILCWRCGFCLQIVSSSALGTKVKDLTHLALGVLHAESPYMDWSFGIPFLVYGEKAHLGCRSFTPFCTEEKISHVMEMPTSPREFMELAQEQSISLLFFLLDYSLCYPKSPSLFFILHLALVGYFQHFPWPLQPCSAVVAEFQRKMQNFF